jgi:hypothetical protein
MGEKIAAVLAHMTFAQDTGHRVERVLAVFGFLNGD